MSLPRLCFALLVTVVSLTAAQPPNVVFIFADDQRADTIAALGNPVIKTPNLDRLVKRGVAFTRAYMQGGNQGATCVPSRAMLLSGRSLAQIDEKLLKYQTWPNAFGAAGYATFATGKWHNGPPSISKSFQQAKALFVGGMANPLKAPTSDMLPTGKLTAAKVSPKHLCEEATDETLAFLKSQDGKKPFFSYLAFDGPHDPHIVPEGFPIDYAPASIPLPPNFLPQHPFDNGEMVIRDEQLMKWPRPAADVKTMLAEYYRYVSFLDVQVGRVLDAVDASPFAANTIIVYAADSGVARGSHGLIGKQNLYEHSVRVPLIIAGPGIVADKRSEAMCYLFDVMPTLGKLCGIPAPKDSQGADFSAVLKDPSQPARPFLMFGYKSFQKALNDGRWKLIRYPHVDRTQLFDLQTDPYETKDLAALPEHAERIKEMLAKLAAEMKADGDNDLLTAAKILPAEWKAPTKLPKPGQKGF
ncbi:MAG: sulfatase-like hydrolase/transferase [Verrucomicrobia bacterium]|nr:sulfatase-like hydrolase/transferase [Verrucomicrobiota bacterium]